MEPEIKAEERDPKKLVRAMQMVTKVLIQDELQSVRQSVADIETRVDERFVQLKEELTKDLTEAIDRAREELGSRIDPLFETMSEAERFRSEVKFFIFGTASCKQGKDEENDQGFICFCIHGLNI